MIALKARDGAAGLRASLPVDTARVIAQRIENALRLGHRIGARYARAADLRRLGLGRGRALRCRLLPPCRLLCRLPCRLVIPSVPVSPKRTYRPANPPLRDVCGGGSNPTASTALARRRRNVLMPTR